MDQDAGATPAAQGCGSCLAEKSLSDLRNLRFCFCERRNST